MDVLGGYRIDVAGVRGERAGRVLTVDPLPAEQARVVGEGVGIAPRLADLGMYRVLLHHPRVAKLVHDFAAQLVLDGRLDPVLRELAIMRVAWLRGSRYVWANHWRVGQRSGASPEELQATRIGADASELTDEQRAVLALTDELVQHGTIDDETWERAGAGLDDRTRIELAVVVSFWRMLSDLDVALDLPLEDGVEPWPPDGRAPEPEVRGGPQ